MNTDLESSIPVSVNAFQCEDCSCVTQATDCPSIASEPDISEAAFDLFDDYSNDDSDDDQDHDDSEASTQCARPAYFY